MTEIRKTLAETSATIYFLDESDVSESESLENVLGLVEVSNFARDHVSYSVENGEVVARYLCTSFF